MIQDSLIRARQRLRELGVIIDEDTDTDTTSTTNPEREDFRNKKNPLTSETKLKHLLLERLGYGVLSISINSWIKISSPRDKQQYLKTRIKELLGRGSLVGSGGSGNNSYQAIFSHKKKAKETMLT